MKKWFCAFLLAASPAWSEPMMYDLVDVPIDQMLGKYRTLVQKKPQDAQNHYVLGRLNAMAYATHCDKFSSQRADGTPFFGMLDIPAPPRQVKPPSDPAQTARAHAYLAQAVEEYRRSVALDPKDLGARLGLAWCLDQKGDKAAAVTQYRKVLTQAYAEDTRPGKAHFGVSFTEETGRYLLELLDPRKDKAEIADVRAKIGKVQKLPRAITPILIPLRPETPLNQLIDPRASVKFDLDGTGRARKWSWITPEAGWLVYLNKRPTVDSGLQMLGSVTFWIFWKNGYQALAALDANDDGWLRGSELKSLALWCDANSDGVCRPEEVISLDKLGISALSCGWRHHPQNFPYSPGGVRYSDGRRGNSYDWMPVSR